MSIMCSVVNDKNVVTFDLGISKRGDPIYRISWYNGRRWKAAHYKNFDDAYNTWKLVSQMI